MVSILLNVLRCVLWPRMWSVLVSVPCEFERMCILLYLDEAAHGYWLYSWLTVALELNCVLIHLLL